MGLINEVSHPDPKILTDVCDLMNRRNFLRSLGKWSPAVIDSLEMCPELLSGELIGGTDGQPNFLPLDGSYSSDGEWTDPDAAGFWVNSQKPVGV